MHKEGILLGKLCIWCNEPSVDSDRSHVVPECFGNQNQQYLAKGIVCRKCNSYFGSKIEPTLIADPIIHAICVATRIVDPGDGNAFRDRMFDEEHRPVKPVDRNLIIDAKLTNKHFDVHISYSVSGQMHIEYDKRRESKFSRALHKIAFEAYVWQFVSKQLPPDASDPFSECFNHIKQWSRYGQPHGKMRPYVRMPAKALANSWEMSIFQYSDHLGLDMRLYGDCFAVSLTSPSELTGLHLQSWCSTPINNAVLVDESYELIKQHA